MFDFLTLTLATYGISNLLCNYDGPYHLFLKARNKYSNSPLQCVVCTSVYIAFILWLATIASVDLTPLAVIGLVVLVERSKWI